LPALRGENHQANTCLVRNIKLPGEIPQKIVRIQMNVQVNTDNHIESSEELITYVRNNLAEHFDRYKNAITRIEVYLSDENGAKSSGDDKRCLLEARIANHQPIAVSHHAETIHVAIEGAADKLLRSLDSMVGRMTDRTTSARDLIVEDEESSTDEDV
jgi:ribosomal subunit interface protein